MLTIKPGLARFLRIICAMDIIRPPRFQSLNVHRSIKVQLRALGRGCGAVASAFYSEGLCLIPAYYLFSICTVRKGKNNEKRPGMAHLEKSTV